MAGLSDRELVALIREGKSEYSSVLYERYTRISAKLASEFYDRNRHLGYEYDDLYSRALESVEIAVRKFNKSKGLSFYKYWRGIAVNSFVDLFNDQSYDGRAKAFRGAFSLDQFDDGDLINAERYGLEEPIETVQGLTDRIISEAKNPENGFLEQEILIISLLLSGYEKDEIISMTSLSKFTFKKYRDSAFEKVKKLFG